MTSAAAAASSALCSTRPACLSVSSLGHGTVHAHFPLRIVRIAVPPDLASGAHRASMAGRSFRWWSRSLRMSVVIRSSESVRIPSLPAVLALAGARCLSLSSTSTSPMMHPLHCAQRTSSDRRSGQLASQRRTRSEACAFPSQHDSRGASDRRPERIGVPRSQLSAACSRCSPRLASHGVPAVCVAPVVSSSPQCACLFVLAQLRLTKRIVHWAMWPQSFVCASRTIRGVATAGVRSEPCCETFPISAAAAVVAPRRLLCHSHRDIHSAFTRVALPAI